jgi:tetratricopeptide (TPR) repeat protein
MDQDKLNTLLNEGIAAARSGQAARARDLLMQVVEADENNEAAWLWLSGVVESLEDRQVCLENVLALNPDSVAAQKGLAWIDQQRAQQGSPLEAASPAETPPPSASELEAPPPSYQVAAPPASPPPAAIPPVTAATPLVRYERQRKREKRSGPLTVVSIGWLLFGLLSMATGVLLVGFSQGVQTVLQDPQLRAQVTAQQGATSEQLALVGEVFKTAGPWGIAIAVLGILCIALAVALLRRVEAAFYASFGLGVIVIGLFAYSAVGTPDGGCACCAVVPIVFLVLTFLARDDFATEEVIVQEKRAEYGADSPLQHYQRGLEYAKEKKLDMTIQEWEKAVALDPANLHFRNALALALAGSEQHPRAIALLEEGLKAFPGDRETKSNLEAIKKAAAKKG